MNNFYRNGIISILFGILLGGCKSKHAESISVELEPTEPFNLQILAPKTSLDYIHELGCFSCHKNEGFPNKLKIKSPDLTGAGSRYKPEYLFNYLLNPTRVRNHIGISRMPNFGFDEKEALALTLYLGGKKDELDVAFPAFEDEGDTKIGKRDFVMLGCSSCHAVNKLGTAVISDLSAIGSKLNPLWMKQFIAMPSIFRGQENIMPGLYYFNSDSSRLVTSNKNADNYIKNIASYLSSLESSNAAAQRDKFQKTKKSNPEINADLGQKIFKSQNCAGCHRADADGVWKNVVARDLSTLGSSVNEIWLSEFLTKPHPIRPFGFYPGSGSRMPDFNLTEVEVENILRFIVGEDHIQKGIQIPKPSKFVYNKIETMLDEKLPCLGCHSLNGKGGKIGPSLSGLRAKLKPAYLESILTNPDVALPGTIMPTIPMPQNLRDQLIEYLYYNKDSVQTSNYLSLVDHPIIFPDDNPSTEALYVSKCGICHGTDGAGFNARYLPTPPTKHADHEYMQKKTNDVLFDGIYAGGYILNKSHLMPAWGSTLSREEIIELVEYMRGLCDCDPPKWSTDNTRAN